MMTFHDSSGRIINSTISPSEATVEEWHRVKCIWDVIDPWDDPELAFHEGNTYRAYKNANGSWDVGSSERQHMVDFSAEDFEKCFIVEL